MRYLNDAYFGGKKKKFQTPSNHTLHLKSTFYGKLIFTMDLMGFLFLSRVSSNGTHFNAMKAEWTSLLSMNMYG